MTRLDPNWWNAAPGELSSDREEQDFEDYADEGQEESEPED